MKKTFLCFIVLVISMIMLFIFYIGTREVSNFKVNPADIERLEIEYDKEENPTYLVKLKGLDKPYTVDEWSYNTILHCKGKSFRLYRQQFWNHYEFYSWVIPNKVDYSKEEQVSVSSKELQPYSALQP